MMKRIVGFANGIIAFLVGAGANAYLIGFLGNVLLPKSIDSGSLDSLWMALLVNLALLGLFGLQQGGTARDGFKKWLCQHIPNLLVGSTYVLASGAVLVILYWLCQPMPSVLWRVEGTVGQVLLWGLFGAGWGLLAGASDSIGALQLRGLRRAYTYLKDEDASPPEFQTSGLYQYTRHLLMLGFLIVFWSTPHMTVGHLLFSGSMTVFIVVGILYEERALIRHLGDRYRQYQGTTLMLIPGIGGRMF